MLNLAPIPRALFNFHLKLSVDILTMLRVLPRTDVYPIRLIEFNSIQFDSIGTQNV